MEQSLECKSLSALELNQVDITPQEYEKILNIQSAILHKIALNHDFDDTLQHLCLLVEQLLPNAVASIMLLNNTTGLMSVLSAPSIPEDGKKSLENLKPGPGAGSCGSAVFNKKPQYVLNTFEDARWADLRKVAFDYNICSCWSMPIKDEKNEVIGTFALSSFEHRNPANFHKKLLETAAFIVNIVLKNKKTDEKLQHMLYYDALTGLHNKTYLDELLKKKEEKTLLLLDINNFSFINNTYGFEIGDKLLVNVANILTETLQYNEVCRLNSDQFAIVLEGNQNITTNVAKIKEYFYSHEIIVDETTLNITFTYGAATGREKLFRKAFISLKHAKTTGKSSLHVYDDAEEKTCLEQRKAFIKANNILHHALKFDELVPYFQGIHNNKTGKITKFEALARITRDGEVLSPYYFIEPAIASGLMPEITKTMIDKSFKIMSKNQFNFSINLTEDDLIRNYVLEYLEQKSKEYNIDPKRVILEILEGVSSNGKRNHIKQLASLKEKGYRIAIDDFGIEYSNFERVLDLDIDLLKIDAKYIKDIDTNPKSYEIVQAIVFFAKKAEIPCVAEFVHSQSVQKVIEELGIEYSQGYIFSEPLPLPHSS